MPLDDREGAAFGKRRDHREADNAWSPGCAVIIGCVAAMVIALYFHRWEIAAVFCVGGLILDNMRAIDLNHQAREEESDG